MRCTFLPGGTDYNTFIKKNWTLVCHYITMLKGYCWIEKTNNCVMVLIIRPGSTLKFQFVFRFSQCLWANFFLLSFEDFWIYIWVVVAWLLILRHRWFYLSHLLPDHPCPWIKKLSAKTTKYILKCWEKSVKRRFNLNTIRVIKNHLLINIFYILTYTWSKPF